ncbi:coiled-coil domain-containing protein [Micromonospora aurantiaca]|uniref:coiled-coil domain-containing protein n=1 Tax=Micromonospora TaxID=1873 RepID=UPI0033E0DE6E
MPRTSPTGRRVRRSLLAAFAAVAVLLGSGVAAGPAAAVPSPNAPNEGGSKQLRAALEAAAKGHIEAQNKLENSKRRQKALAAQLKDVEVRLVGLSAQAGEVAAQSYRMGRLTATSMLLASADPNDFLKRAAELDVMAQRDSKRLRELADAKAQAAEAKLAIDAEVREQAKQVAVQARKKKDAEVALAKVSSGAGSGFNGTSSSAKPAPRSSDGSWPSESCSVDDPTPASGCITPRTLHMLQQAKAAGYKRYASCHRSGGGGEHPKGRACDFSAASGGFEDKTATGGDKAYGDSLAAWAKNNANRLGIMYVIWYRQIWMPNTGWRAYSGGGSPAADHTNHVHISMY